MRYARLLACATLLIQTLAFGSASGESDDPMSIPAIKSFVGQGFGARNGNAPAQIDEFGRLAGVWSVAVELRRQDGSWMESAPSIWAWKYVIDGFA